MSTLAPFIAPALALFLIVRRGSTPRRIRPNGLWIFPLIITLLAGLAISQGGAPSLLAYGAFAVALAAGAALGWFTTQHAELTLDDATGTIMSKPSLFGTLLTAAVFALRFGIEYLVNGTPGGGAPPPHAPVRHAAGLLWLADAGLLFVAARMLAQAGHMWLRIRPLLARRKPVGPQTGA